MKFYALLLITSIMVEANGGYNRFCEENPNNPICTMFKSVENLKGNVDQLGSKTDDLDDIFMKEINETEIALIGFLEEKLDKMSESMGMGCGGSDMQDNVKEIKKYVRKMSYDGTCPKGCHCQDGCTVCSNYVRCNEDSDYGMKESDYNCSSGAKPLSKDGDAFNCTSDSCPLLMQCENTTDDNMKICCPKADNATSFEQDKKDECALGSKIPLKAGDSVRNDCNAKVCPKTYYCTVSDATTHYCCFQALDNDVKVDVLIEGKMMKYDGDVMKHKSSISLISTKSEKIFVNFGWPRDAVPIIRGLIDNDLDPSDINYGIITDNDIWAMGATAPFSEMLFILPDGKSAMGYQMWTNPLKVQDNWVVGPNVEIVRTDTQLTTGPDVSVFVYNVGGKGTVVITGAVVGDQKWLEDEKTRPDGWDADPMKASVKKVVCPARYIVPGFGSMFEVTDTHRSNVGC